MYAKYKNKGIGSELLKYLENCGIQLGYKTFWLETRKVNTQAVNFYESQGYKTIPNYGRYVGRTEAVCFEKKLEKKF